MQAHVLAHFLADSYPTFPFICLTVSGGHTQLVRVDSHLKMTVMGRSIDDAAGEAFDKSGKLLNLPYPAGPEIDKIAAKGIASFKFAKPNIDGLDFSFSGLKTSILYFIRDKIKEDPHFVEKNLADLCASIQHSIVDILMQKLVTAAELYGIKQIAIAGGVAANSRLREQLQTISGQKDWQVYIPKFDYCTDNAAMIGIVAHYKYMDGMFADLDSKPDPRLSWEQV
jgi:N6-L-threonylcarbamoyladenine synthase